MNPRFACLRPLCLGIRCFGSVQTDILSDEPEMVILALFTLANTVCKTDSKGVVYMHGLRPLWILRQAFHAHSTLANTVPKTDSKRVIYMHGLRPLRMTIRVHKMTKRTV